MAIPVIETTTYNKRCLIAASEADPVPRVPCDPKPGAREQHHREGKAGKGRQGAMRAFGSEPAT